MRLDNVVMWKRPTGVSVFYDGDDCTFFEGFGDTAEDALSDLYSEWIEQQDLPELSLSEIYN